MLLQKQVDKITKASLIVMGDLTQKQEKDLIRFPNRFNEFCRPFYHKNLELKLSFNKVLKSIN